MPGGIFQRHGHTIHDDGTITYDDRPVTWEHGDALADRHLDRRRCYAIIDGAVNQLARWSAACSGCNETLGAEAGSGCPECGYTGRRRDGAYVPLDRLPLPESA